jgi:hypothetical protein
MLTYMPREIWESRLTSSWSVELEFRPSRERTGIKEN